MDAVSYLEMKGITKRYRDEVFANRSIDFSVEQNEIHAVIGENGAGKTTLMKILYGLEQPDAGTIFLRGERVVHHGPQDAKRLRIGMVHQHFMLVPEFTVAENVVLGIEPVRSVFFVDRTAAAERIRRIVESHGFSIDPRSRVQDLTVGQMQQVEIVRMLYREAELLILDEPTSVLAEQEIHRLFQTLRSLTKDGKTCVIVTHKLREVKEISDRVTVLRKGSVVAVRKTADVDRAELSRLMVGKSVLYQVERAAVARGRPVLALEEVSLVQRRRHRPLLDRITFSVHAGEIVGLAGVSGNGLSELEDLVTGLRRNTGGRILLNGEDIAGLAPATLRERGLAYVPADRLRRGASLGSTMMENMIVTNHHRFMRGGFLARRRIEQFTRALAEGFAIDGEPRDAVGTLSGGNIQKVILARELAHHADLVVAAEPTWGLDVASSQFVYEKMLAMRAAGAGILLLSSNLDEIIGIADTIAVIYRGRIVALFPNTTRPSKEYIGEYLLGLRDDYPAHEQRGRDGGA